MEPAPAAITTTISGGHIEGSIIGSTLNNPTLNGDMIVNGLPEDVFFTKLMTHMQASGLSLRVEREQLDRATIIKLAQRLRPEALDLDSAVRELEHAVTIACDVIHSGLRPAGNDELVDQVLYAVAQHIGDVDAGAALLDDALAELDRRAAEQQAALQRGRTELLEATIRQETLRRDPVAVARRMLALVALQQTGDRAAWQPAFKARYDDCLDEGAQQGILFSLEVAVELARLMAQNAADGTERVTAAVRLGFALDILGGREVASAHLEEAVAVLRAGAAEVSADANRELWSTLHMVLSSTLTALGEREGNLQRMAEAEAAARLALDGLSCESDPDRWARCRLTLGSALGVLGVRNGDVVVLQEAVAALRDSVGVFSQQTEPDDWARGQLMLGMTLSVYGEAMGSVPDLEEAVAELRGALALLPPQRLPLEWGRGMLLLGATLLLLVQHNGSAESLDEALVLLEQGLTRVTPEIAPLEWARGQLFLGCGLLSRGRGARDPAQLQKAANALRAARASMSREATPRYWGWATTALGQSLTSLGALTASLSLIDAGIAELQAVRDMPSMAAAIEAALGEAKAERENLATDR